MTEINEDMSQPGKDVFDFFGLPRELRNEIYSLLTEVKYLSTDRGENDEHPTKVSIAAAPLNHPLTLCRQFKTEYEETFKHGLKITFQDMGGQIRAPQITGDLDKITRAEIIVIAFCGELPSCALPWCGAADDTNSHVTAIKTTVQNFKNL